MACYDNTASAHLRLAAQVRCGRGQIPLHPNPFSGITAIAIFHASTKTIARSSGRSSVAAAAYRSAVELVDERTGLVHDYTRRAGVVSCEVILADGGTADRSALWNAAEQAEKRKDSRTAREWVVGLPAELNARERADLARSFGVELAARYGVAVDVAIHLPDREGDNRNHHAHILTTTRQVSRAADGDLVMGAKAHIELSDTKRRSQGLGSGADEVKAIRQLWEQLANRALSQAGQAVRIDARSLQDQGIDREATTHLGPVASEMERRGVGSDRGDGNRQAQANNAERKRLSAEIIDLQAVRATRAYQADPERVVREWESVYQLERGRIDRRAKHLVYRIHQATEKLDQRRQAHRRQEPTAPTGLFRLFKQKAYDQAAHAWKAIEGEIAKRLDQLRRRDELARRYEISGLHGNLGDPLADRKTAAKLPLLAGLYRDAKDVVLRRRAERLQQERQEARRNRQRRSL